MICNKLSSNAVALILGIMKPLVVHGALRPDDYDIVRWNLKQLGKQPVDQTTAKEEMQLITGEEAARLLSISYSEFRRLYAAGAFSFKRRRVGGKSSRYVLKDIHRFIEFESVDSREAAPVQISGATVKPEAI